MKMKMLVAGAAAVAVSFCAHAIETSSTTFDALEEGAFDATQAEDGKYWWKSANESNGQIVANDGGYEGARAATPGATDRALDIDAAEPLYRGLAGRETAGDEFAEVSANGVFLDNLIQIGLQSEAPESLPEGIKFAMWGMETNDVQKLFIRAGKVVDEELTPFDYEIDNLPQEFDCDDWHRVTVKAIVEGEEMKFKFYIDGTLAQTADGITEFPSLVAKATTISAIAYQGSGLVDDIVVTDAIPECAAVARVGATYYEDLQTAVDAAIGTGDSLDLLQQVTASIYIPGGEDGCEFTANIPTSFTSYDFAGMLHTDDGYEIQQTPNEAPEGYTSITFTVVKAETPTDQYVSPDGTTSFHITDTVTLPEGAKLGDTAVTIDGTAISYAAAYALGLYEDPEKPVKDIVVQIQIVDGKVVLTNNLEDNSNYVVTVKYEKRTDLKTGEWAEVENADNIAIDSENGKGFFRIKVSAIGIADKE